MTSPHGRLRSGFGTTCQIDPLLRRCRTENRHIIRSVQLGEVTRKSAEQILGALDDNAFAAIEASGANLKDIAEAKAIADGSSDIVGQGEQALAGPVKELLTILGGSKK